MKAWEATIITWYTWLAQWNKVKGFLKTAKNSAAYWSYSLNREYLVMNCYGLIDYSSRGSGHSAEVAFALLTLPARVRSVSTSLMLPSLSTVNTADTVDSATLVVDWTHPVMASTSKMSIAPFQNFPQRTKNLSSRAFSFFTQLKKSWIKIASIFLTR